MPRSRLHAFAPLFALLAPAAAGGSMTSERAPAVSAEVSLLRPQASPEGFPALDNAALLYYQIFLQIDRKALDGIKPDDAPKDWAPDAKGVEVLKANAGLISTAVRASQLPRCDWGVEYGLGWTVLLPQLGPFRTLARTLDADARRLIAERGAGASSETAPRLAAILRMGDQVCQNPVLINSLVGVAVASLGVMSVEHALDAQALDAAGRDEVLAAARSLLTDDPFHLKAALRGEAAISLVSLERVRTDPQSPLARSILAVMQQGEKPLDPTTLDAAAHAQNVALLNSAYERMIAACGQPNAEELFTQVNTDIDQGRHGVYARVLLPAINAAHRGRAKAVDRVKALVTRLEQYAPPAPKP